MRAFPTSDMHNDLLMLVARRPRHQWATYFRDHWIPQLRAGGVTVQILPIFVDAEFRPEGALRESIRMAEAAHVVAAANADEVMLCTGADDFVEARRRGLIALVLALEGCPQIDDDLELLGTFHRLGVRMVSLTHLGRSALADGSGEDHTGSRLTYSGIEAIGVLEELRILVDVSHLGWSGTEHVLEIATRPVVASHSSARSIHDHHRNLTDDHIRRIAESGGVVGVNFFAGYLTHDEPTVAHLLRHVDHVVEVAGIGHVGIGADFIREILDEKVPLCDRPVRVAGVDAERIVPGLGGPAGLPLLGQALVDEGWDGADVERFMGGNVRALLESAL